MSKYLQALAIVCIRQNLHSAFVWFDKVGYVDQNCYMDYSQII